MNIIKLCVLQLYTYSYVYITYEYNMEIVLKLDRIFTYLVYAQHIMEMFQKFKNDSNFIHIWTLFIRREGYYKFI